MYLISPHKNQYKANLHCHSTLSDGKRTPRELKEDYKAHGYHILAITDHEVPKDHSVMSEPGFLMLTGYENYIRTTEGGVYHRYRPEVHLNLFARDPHNETRICYNPCYCKYLTPEPQAAMPKAGSQRPREYSREYINEYIRTARENGYLVSYNHAYWSMEEEADILAYDGYFSMEMVNYSSYLSNNLEYNAALYDRMLLSGKRVFCHAGDDNHNKRDPEDPEYDSYGGITMILADELKYDRIIEAMELGEMYSTMGPLFHEVSFDGTTLHVECSEVARIHVYFGSKTPTRLCAKPGETLSGGDLHVDPDCRYVRVSIFDRDGMCADTRGFFRDELGLPPLE